MLIKFFLPKICSLSGNGELAFCDVTGQLGTVINCYEKVIEPNTEDDNLDLMETIEREIGIDLENIKILLTM